MWKELLKMQGCGYGSDDDDGDDDDGDDVSVQQEAGGVCSVHWTR